MSYLNNPSIEETASFARSIGYPLNGAKITRVFPLYHHDRFVFQTYKEGDHDSSVVKIRPNDHNALRERDSIARLVRHYGRMGFNLTPVDTHFGQTHLGIVMPFLGYSLHELTEHLDSLAYGDIPQDGIMFDGFTPTQIDTLTRQLLEDQRNFYSKTGLVHGDILTNEGPNNIAYHPFFNRLMLIDGEAFHYPDGNGTQKFEKELEDVSAWMHGNVQG